MLSKIYEQFFSLQMLSKIIIDLNTQCLARRALGARICYFYSTFVGKRSVHIFTPRFVPKETFFYLNLSVSFDTSADLRFDNDGSSLFVSRSGLF
jgi:hypothetical protein